VTRLRPGRLAVSGAFLCPAISFLWILLPAAGLLAGCGGSDSAWERDVLDYRARVDEFLSGPETPLTPEERALFEGLSYYAPDPSWRLETVPDRTGAGAPAEILDNQGTPRSYRVHSRLTFRHGDDVFTLTVYQSTDNPELFLPFGDATNGEETYGAGRYVPVDVLPEGKVRVDFNRAKNPYCAYSPRWACPLVPAENRLDIAVPAGEKRYAHEPVGH